MFFSVVFRRGRLGNYFMPKWAGALDENPSVKMVHGNFNTEFPFVLGKHKET